MIRRLVFTFMVCCLILTSCNDWSKSELRHPVFINAKRLRKQKKYSLAAKAFNRYLQINPKSVKSHYELATLYHDHLNDPLLAIYHYRCYLKNAPTSKDAEKVNIWLEKAEYDYYLQLKDRYPDTENKLKIEHLISQNKKFRQYIIHLRKRSKGLINTDKTDIETVESKSTPGIVEDNRPMKSKDISTVSATTNQKKNGSQKTQKFYTVQKGDTLMRISKSVYGSSKYYNLIYSANREILPSEAELQVGQRLVIPPLPATEKIVR